MATLLNKREEESSAQQKKYAQSKTRRQDGDGWETKPVSE